MRFALPFQQTVSLLSVVLGRRNGRWWWGNFMKRAAVIFSQHIFGLTKINLNLLLGQRISNWPSSALFRKSGECVQFRFYPIGFYSANQKDLEFSNKTLFTELNLMTQILSKFFDTRLPKIIKSIDVFAKSWSLLEVT